MSTFVTVPVTTDPDDIADAAVAYLQSQIPGWELSDGQLEAWLIEAVARMTSEAAVIAAQVPAGIFAAFGARFLGITQRAGDKATTSSTWTGASTAGYTIPQGALVAYRTSGDTGVLFAVSAAVTVPAGASSAAVQLEATDVGAYANAVPAGTALELVDSLSYVTDVALTSATAGGADPESDVAYLARLRTELQLLTPRPILPADFAVLATRIAGVGRALAVSGYNPGDGTTSNERYVAVALATAAGAPVSGGVASAVQAYLDGLREVNFVVATFDPTFTTINVTYTVHVLTGYTASTVITAVTAAIGAWLSPAAWGGGDAIPPAWDAGQNVVRRLQLATVIAAVPGVDYIGSLTINGGTGDVVMGGLAPLPTPGTITGTAI